MAKATHQPSSGSAPGWAHCGAWIAPGQETDDPTCPRCAAAGAREASRTVVIHRNATAHHTDAMGAFLSGDLLAPAPAHYAPIQTHDTKDGTQYWAECQGCDWTTVKLPDRAAVDALTARHYRNPGTDEHRLPIHRTEATTPRGSCSTCEGGGCPDCTDLGIH